MKKFTAFFFIFIAFYSYAEGGITIGATRVIYNEGAKQESLKIINKNKDAQYLVQSWVTKSDKDNEATKTFITTPPIFALKNDTTGTVRVMALKTEKLPSDRESVFYLNIKTIPAIQEKQNSNEAISGRLIVTTRSILKLFYRPASISNPDYAKMFDKLTGEIINGKSYIINETPYHVTATKFNIEGKGLDEVKFIEPFSKEKIYDSPLPKINFKIVNDFGGTTDKTITF
ncbi:molecular chaperone [Enterobacter quasihormaechei]|uniref:fimbrial biogenesis chaperone n=1 Tax=Enterobacter quasihormaechei TaxID=2529382 RepID=UPI0015E081CB